MTTIHDWDGVEHEIRFRRVPGYYNRSTYHVDIDHKHVMTVTRISDATWSRSALWAAYLPGVDWSKGPSAERAPFHLGGDRSRELAVKMALRKLARLTDEASATEEAV